MSNEIKMFTRKIAIYLTTKMIAWQYFKTLFHKITFSQGC